MAGLLIYSLAGQPGTTSASAVQEPVEYHGENNGSLEHPSVSGTMEQGARAGVIMVESAQPITGGERGPLQPDRGGLNQNAPERKAATIAGTLRDPDLSNRISVDSITVLQPDPAEPYREAMDAEVSSYLSADGTLAWAVEGLLEGECVISYGDLAVSLVELAPGPNMIDFELPSSSDMQLLFVDRITGEPVDVDMSSWVAIDLSMKGFEFPGRSVRKNILANPGNQQWLNGIRGSMIRVTINSREYGRQEADIRVIDGGVEVMELDPGFYISATVVDASGTPVTRFHPEWAPEIIMLADGQRFTPASSGMNADGLYAVFHGVDKAYAEWELILHPSLELVSKSSGVIGPVGSAMITVTKSKP